MVQAGGFRIDFTEWEEYAPMIHNASINVFSLQKQFLDEVGSELVAAIRSHLDSYVSPGRRFPITQAGRNYYDSWAHLITEDGPEPSMVIGQIRNADPRLGIYWKVVEAGARPTINVPEQALIAWAAVKFGNPALGKAVADNIRIEGISAQAPLSAFFTFGPDLRATGFTERGMIIIRKALQRYAQSFTEFLRRGRTTRVRRDALGRFARQI